MLRVPDIQLKDVGDSSICSLPLSDEAEFGENIALMMMETSNTYEDCMHMPIAVFLNTIKHIRISELMQNKEWREAYLNKLAEERVLKNKGISKTKMDMAGLKSFAQKL